jgi:hypothetical protein
MGADKEDFFPVQDQIVIHFFYFVAMKPPTTLVMTI